MSRIGKKPIVLPSGVEVLIEGQQVKVKGQKGVLERVIHGTVELVQEGSQLKVSLKNPKERSHGRFHGLTRTLVNNMVEGVTRGFSKSLTLIGVGYRANVQGRELHLTLGYSHPIVFKIPQGIDISVDKQVNVVVTGIQKEQVGQVAAIIRGYRKPEPYHGKGVRYSDEVIVTKVGKSSGKK